MMPILVKGDSVRGGTKANALHGRWEFTKEAPKSKFCGISGVFELPLDRFPEFIIKGFIVELIWSRD